MRLSNQKITRFQRTILRWYAKNKRALPWRNTCDPYRILVSEIMLQQTQVERVIPYYELFLLEFPTLMALAKADKITLLKTWQGLGYNSRALRLQQCAQCILEKYQGRIPASYDALLKLAGIGPYTARAVLTFAFNKEVPVIDTNIRRVLIHTLNLDENIVQEELELLAQQCIPHCKSREWHNALMDYGALHVTACKTGIASLSKQGKFEGSTRQVRSNIVKHLLKKKSATLRELQTLYPHKEFDSVVEKMLREGLVKQQKGTLAL